jgi:hypothetical protein
MSGGHVAIHAAMQKRKKLREEEEEMANYSREELAGDWEFKIVRSAGRAFSKPEVLETVLEEEALAGWELIEKFDDKRLRFKRPHGARDNDLYLPEGVDPYRTQYGISEDAIGAIVGLSLMGLLALGLLIAWLAGAI